MGAILSAISGLATGLVTPITTYLSNRQQINAQIHANKLKYLQAVGDRQAQLVSQGLAADATWEMASIKAGQQFRGFELYVLSVPLILCFIPGGAQYVQAGFASMAQTPFWYQTALLSVFYSNYGIRLWRRNFVSDT